jgi:hypothetical protein
VESNDNKTCHRVDRVTVLGVVCEKMVEWLVISRKEEVDRRVRQEVSRITQDESVDEEDMVDDESVEDEREIWEVVNVSEKDLEGTEGEGVDFLADLLELVGWSQVNDKETEEDLS